MKKKFEKVDKLVIEKFSIKYGPTIERFPFEEGDIKTIKYYSGHSLNGKPNGKGILEVYKYDSTLAKLYKSQKIKTLWKKYSKYLIEKSVGFVLEERYAGNWILGKKDGKGEKTEYIGVFDSDHVDIFLNKNFSPIIKTKKNGIFKKDKEQGKFQVFDMVFGWYTINYKNGKAITKPSKISKKNNLNNEEGLIQGFPEPWDDLAIKILKNR